MMTRQQSSIPPGSGPGYRIPADVSFGQQEYHRHSGNRNGQGDGQSTWDGNFYGSSSTPSFMSSYREYLERLGFALPPTRLISPSVIQGSNSQESPANISNENITTASSQMRRDLRYLLPNKEVADCIKQVYWRSRQVYQPTFYWPMVERKWKRAWAEPIWEDDEHAVRGVFCIVMMFLAVGGQLAGADFETDERYVSVSFGLVGGC